MAHWNADSILCQNCPDAKGHVVMELLATVPGKIEKTLFWCPLCGTVAHLYDEPISTSDFVVPYVSYSKGSMTENGGNRVRRKEDN